MRTSAHRSGHDSGESSSRSLMSYSAPVTAVMSVWGSPFEPSTPHARGRRQKRK